MNIKERIKEKIKNLWQDIYEPLAFIGTISFLLSQFGLFTPQIGELFKVGILALIIVTILIAVGTTLVEISQYIYGILNVYVKDIRDIRQLKTRIKLLEIQVHILKANIDKEKEKK